jgi:hypothetical protein
MTNTPVSQRRSYFGAIARWWRNRIGNRAAVAEVRKINPEELRRVALDAGVNPDELHALAAQWPNSADLLRRRMTALHLDPAGVMRAYPAVANDLRRLCSLCQVKGRCERELSSDPDNRRWREYCPNVATLSALTAEGTHSNDPGTH